MPKKLSGWVDEDLLKTVPGWLEVGDIPAPLTIAVVTEGISMASVGSDFIKAMAASGDDSSDNSANKDPIPSIAKFSETESVAPSICERTGAWLDDTLPGGRVTAETILMLYFLIKP